LNNSLSQDFIKFKLTIPFQNMDMT